MLALKNYKYTNRIRGTAGRFYFPLVPLKFITLAFAIVFFTVVGSISSVKAEISKLEKIRLEVEQENKLLSKIDRDLESLASEMNKVEVDIKTYRQREANLSGELQNIEEQNEQVLLELEEIQKKSEQINRVLSERLVSLYFSRKDELVNPLYKLASSSNFSRSAYYLKLVRTHDLELLSSLDILASERQAKTDELEKLLGNRDLVRQKLVSQRKLLEQELLKQKQLKQTLLAKKKLREPVMTRLQVQALRLETVMLSYTNQAVSRRSLIDKKPSDQQKQELSDYEGLGLMAYKGKLGLPVDGKVVRGFGRHQDHGFRDLVLDKGWLFEVGPQQTIKAIAPGQVMFLGEMPGYGTLIILNHDKRYYSLYSQLKRPMVTKGQIVEAGQDLAYTQKDQGLYFEIRFKGEAINPEKLYPKHSLSK